MVTNAGDPTYGADTLVRQALIESNNLLTKNAVAIGQNGMWDFSLISDYRALGAYYCFRVAKSDGTPLGTYTSIASVLLPPLNSQQMRHGSWFSSGDKGRQPFYW
jgi:hypothetical protein